MKTPFSTKLSIFFTALLFVFVTVGCTVSLQEEVPSGNAAEDNGGGDAAVVEEQQPAPEQLQAVEAVQAEAVAIPNPAPAPEESAEQPAIEPAAEQPAESQDLVPAVEAQPAAEENVVVEAPQPAVEPAPAEPAPDLSAGTNQGQQTVHVVRPRDTIGAIAQGYNIPIEAILAANPWVGNSFLIKPGDELIIPPAGEEVYAAPVESQPAVDNSVEQGGNNYTSYYVQYGDTIGLIAQNYGYSIEELANYNGIVNINQIEVGQEIRIPSR